MFKLILQQKNLLISSLLNESWAWNNQLEMEQKLLIAKKLVERYNTDKKFKEEILNSVMIYTKIQSKIKNEETLMNTFIRVSLFLNHNRYWTISRTIPRSVKLKPL